MSELRQQRDDGPLARSLPGGRLPVLEVPVMLVAVGVGLVGGALAVAGGWPAPWAWTLAGVGVALVGCLGRDHPRLGWPVPGLLRLLEYGSVLVLLGASPWAYALLAAVAFHHYDIVYRARTLGEPPPRWLTAVTGGWELRTTAIAVAVPLGVVEPAAAVLAAVLVATYVSESVGNWTHEPRRGEGQ